MVVHQVNDYVDIVLSMVPFYNVMLSWMMSNFLFYVNQQSIKMKDFLINWNQQNAEVFKPIDIGEKSDNWRLLLKYPKKQLNLNINRSVFSWVRRGLADVRQLLLQDGNESRHVRHPVRRPGLLHPGLHFINISRAAIFVWNCYTMLFCKFLQFAFLHIGKKNWQKSCYS